MTIADIEVSESSMPWWIGGALGSSYDNRLIPVHTGEVLATLQESTAFIDPQFADRLVYRLSARQRPTRSSLSSIPRPAPVGNSMKPSRTFGSGVTSSRRNGLSNTCGETYSKIGAAGQAA
jgi:hypothetical protein